ncbi:MAG: hypothetical protein HY517_04365, partial [Candidatus Aenigmarchaeota archaeon]|nr:hypothetical protein [Candidatus Aenigmarchaeota archaeon]
MIFSRVPSGIDFSKSQLSVYYDFIGGSGVSFSDRLKQSTTCPNADLSRSVCSAAFRPDKAGNYFIDFVVRDASNSELAKIEGEKIEVVSGSTSSAGDTGRCCVVQKGLEYTYHPDVRTNEECKAKEAESGGTDNRFYATSSCTAVQHTVCDTFCKNEQDTGGGNCGFSSTRQDTYQFDKVCQSGMCRCSGGGQRDYRDVPCDQACLTPSQSYLYSSSFASAQRATIPFGQCSSNPQAIIAAWSFSA